MTRQEAINILLDHFSEGMVRTIVDAIAEDEREECAKICDAMDSISDYYTLRVELICAQAIRARGQE